jgi:hypothetical protein
MSPFKTTLRINQLEDRVNPVGPMPSDVTGNEPPPPPPEPDYPSNYDDNYHNHGSGLPVVW